MNFWSIIGVVAVSAGIWLWFLMRYDRFEKEPLKVVLRVGLVGGCVSVFIAGFLNTTVAGIAGIDINDLSLYGAIFFSLFVGFNEETMKSWATWLMVRKEKELDEPIDALIYAMTVGLGFAALENITYMAQYGSSVILSRSLLSTPVHLVLAALWGYGIAKARFVDPEQKYFRNMAPYVIMAALLHAFYDFLLFTQTIAALLVVPLLILLLIASHRRLKWMAGQTDLLAVGQCSACGRKNDPEAAFCGTCGTPMKQTFYNVCDNCSTKVPVRFSYCPECGTSTDHNVTM